MTTLLIGDKLIPCPNPPLFYVKSFGHVVDIKLTHAEANHSFESNVSSYGEIWKLDEKGIIRCIRRMVNGKDSALKEPNHG